VSKEAPGYSVILSTNWSQNILLLNRRQKELEVKLVEEETAKRIEEMVAKRVAEELERRKDEIEAEVLRRVEEAKAIMEKEMMEELQRQRLAQLEEERRREVATDNPSTFKTLYLLYGNNSHNWVDLTTSVIYIDDETFSNSSDNFDEDIALLAEYQEGSLLNVADYYSLHHDYLKY
jgi:hypothetical protein